MTQFLGMTEFITDYPPTHSTEEPDFIAIMDTGEIEYNPKTKKAQRQSKKVSEAAQGKIK